MTNLALFLLVSVSTIFDHATLLLTSFFNEGLLLAVGGSLALGAPSTSLAMTMPIRLIRI
jgi:hypothetical protein